MTNEKEWWMERPWITGAKIGDFTKNTFVAEDICNDVIKPLVAEAERRGRLAAWSEAKAIVENPTNDSGDICRLIDAKLTSLKTS